VHFVGLFFVFIIENARSKKQNNSTYFPIYHSGNMISKLEPSNFFMSLF